MCVQNGKMTDNSYQGAG